MRSWAQPYAYHPGGKPGHARTRPRTPSHTIDLERVAQLVYGSRRVELTESQIFGVLHQDMSISRRHLQRLLQYAPAFVTLKDVEVEHASVHGEQMRVSRGLGGCAP